MQKCDFLMACITDDWKVSEAFAMTNGLKQAGFLASTIFSLMFSVLLMDAYRDENPGIRIASELMGTSSTADICRPLRAFSRPQSTVGS
ncbi:unnamed protein product [Dibothriocephalus latus]|uniref:Reverse transcriptase domain-containing protein n=1 Tax=Dibothriocephalus latus TaxID=60516 RepID=A0A3P6Q5P4_DIBLA|nr:unnamed protein product [Dibothriocephalus latus]